MKLLWPALSLLFAAAAWFSIQALIGEAHAARRLVSQEQARHLGLERAWFAQVRLDRARNRVERAVLTGDRLTVLTSAGVVHEFNAHTGETLWIASIGNPSYPSLGPAANEQFVALLNGSTLYVLDRIDGRPVIVRPAGSAPGAAPGITRKHVFVPLVNGRVEGYSVDEPKITPWYYQSFGRAMVPPLTTPESVVWATDSGHAYIAGLDPLGLRFRLETGSEIVAQPAYRKPYVYLATITGEVFAMHELTGARRWKYTTGYPIVRAPAAVADRVFVTSQEPALHCVDATNGNSLWEAPNVTQFAAMSRNRVYGVDELGALVVLDATTGALLGRMPSDGMTNALVNDQTDRLYLITREGAVQCLHELDADQPLYHSPPEAPPEAAGETAAGETTAPEAPAEAPPATETPPPEAAEDPFGEVDAEEALDEAEMAEDPGEFGVDDENPFGDF
jgi:outer membrane protein assembly factor BamB